MKKGEKIMKSTPSEGHMKKVKKLLEKRALWNKKHIPVPLINWVAPAAMGVK